MNKQIGELLEIIEGVEDISWVPFAQMMVMAPPGRVLDDSLPIF